MGSLMLTQLFYQAAITQPLSAMDEIGSHYGADFSEKNWFMASLPLATSTCVLSSGRLGDIYGLKKMMIGGYIWTIIWSLLSGIAYYSTVEFYIVARAFEGLGIAFIMPNMMGIAGTVYTPRTQRKNMVFALIGGCAPIGACMGAFFSGLIANFTARWDWAQYAHAIAMAATLIVTWWIVPDNLPVNANNVSMDWWGSLLGVTSLVLFNFVWNQAPGVGWDSPYIIVLLIVSVLMFVAFMIWEEKFSCDPLIPHSLKKADKNLHAVLLAMLFGWGSFGVWLLYYFRFLVEFRGYGPLHMGWTVWPLLISGIAAAMTVGFLLSVIRTEYILLFSMIAFTVPCVLLAVAPVHQTWFRTTFGACMIIGFGMDMSYPASSIVLSDTLPPDCQGMAGSLVNTLTGYAQSIFLGFGGTVEVYLQKDGLDSLAAFRGALWFAVGCGGLATVIAMVPAYRVTFHPEKTPHHFEEKEKAENTVSTSLTNSTISDASRC